MLLQPRKTKYQKVRKGKLNRFKFKSKLDFGNFGLKALESGIVTAKHLHAANQAITRKIKKTGKVWLKVYPSLPITKKPTEVRMGKGKGNVSHWATKVRSGSIIFEIIAVNEKIARKAFKTGSAKLPIKTKVFK